MRGFGPKKAAYVGTLGAILLFGLSNTSGTNHEEYFFIMTTYMAIFKVIRSTFKERHFVYVIGQHFFNYFLTILIFPIILNLILNHMSQKII